MRGLILALVFANVAFFAYARFVGEPARQMPLHPPAPPIPRLQLAAEVGDLAAQRCFTIGPFAEQPAAERAVLWLRAQRREPRLRTTVREDGTAYWVSLPTPTLQQATRVALRLRAAGVADVEVLPPTPEQTGAVVSLGLYSERERADRRVAELRGYAVTPTVAVEPRAVTNWWIDVDRTANEGAFDPRALIAAVPEAKSVVVQTCPAIERPGAGTTSPAAGAGAASPAAGSVAPESGATAPNGTAAPNGTPAR